MELIFPWAIYVGAVTFIVLLIFKLKNKYKYSEGTKVANTGMVEDTPLYKSLYKQYKILLHIALFSLLIGILCGFFMMSRPAKVERINTTLHNRDIFLCLDISDSMDELNLSMCKKLMKVVEELEGERFGISIFNAKSVTLVPLTTDYKYVLEVLEKLNKSFEVSLKMSEPDFDYEDFEELSNAYSYKYEGTLSYEGSSLIGDGLATCLYSFPDLEDNDERSRMIIFATDNELNGTPYVTVEEAARLCKKNNVKVFAIAPEYTADEEVFMKAMKNTGGNYYNTTDDDAFDDLIKDIEKTEASEMEKVEIRIYEQPQIPFICMLVFIGIYFVISRKVKL